MEEDDGTAGALYAHFLLQETEAKFQVFDHGTETLQYENLASEDYYASWFAKDKRGLCNVLDTCIFDVQETAQLHLEKVRALTVGVSAEREIEVRKRAKLSRTRSPILYHDIVQ